MTRSKTFRAVAALLFAAALLLPLAADAQPAPNWPENNWIYNCNYTWPDGTTGGSQIYFHDLWATSHKFGDGNELKRGEMTTQLPGTTLWTRVDIAYKPYELPNPPYGTRFEITFVDSGIQCKNFVNYSDVAFTFDQCSNGIVQTCSLFFVP